MFKFWCYICLLILLWSISIHLEEKDQVSYHFITTNQPKKSIKHLFCFDLIDIFNKSLINLNELENGLYNYLETKKLNDLKSNQIEYENDLKLIFNLIRQKYYLIYSDYVCIILERYIKIHNIHLLKLNSTYFIGDLDAYEFLEIENLNSPTEILIIINFNCHLTDNKYQCLFQCSKSKQRLAKYIYTSKDVGLIYLNYQLNETIQQNEIKCIELCRNQINCKLIYFIQQNYSKKMEDRIVIIKAYLLVDSFKFILILISIIFLFLNICLTELLIIIIKKIKINLIKSFKHLHTLIIFILNLILFFSIITYMIIKYIELRDNPFQKEVIINLFENKPINLSLCIEMNQILNRTLDDTYLDNRTYIEIDNLLDNYFNRSSINVYLQFLNKKFNINWYLIKSITIFKGNKRCYQIKITAFSSKYNNLLSLSKLTIETQYRNVDFFLLTENRKLNSQTYKINDKYAFKKIVKRLSKVNRKIKCLNYNLLNLKFNGKIEFIDECINLKFYKLYKIPSHFTILRKDNFNHYWPNLIYTIKGINSYKKTLKKIKQTCQLEFIEPDCLDVRFEESAIIKSENLNSNGSKIEISFNYDVFNLIEEEISYLKLLLDLLNIQVILFGVNAFKLIQIISNFKFKFKKLLIYCLCLIGFNYHLWLIFNEIIYGEIITSQYYIIPKQIVMPSIVFCIKKDDENIKINNIINKIEYLNELNQWILLDNKSIEYRIDSIQQCSIIKNEIIYNQDQFLYSKNANVLKVYFNRTIIHQFNKSFYCYTKMKSINQASRIKELNFKNLNSESIQNTIRQELFEIELEDKFLFIKNPNSIFNNKIKQIYINNYLNRMINYFGSNNFRNDQIKNSNDQLFDLFFNQTIINNYRTSFNSNKRQFSINYLNQKMLIKSTQADFHFNLIYFKRYLKMRNEDNISKLILNLLNLLSFWFDLGVIEIFIYLDKIKIIFYYLIRFFRFLKQQFRI